MKCGNCANNFADGYYKVFVGSKLFEVCLKMFRNNNPNLLYKETNSYFCDKCLCLAEKYLIENHERLLNEHNSTLISLKGHEK